jgi:transposase InsO family protein
MNHHREAGRQSDSDHEQIAVTRWGTDQPSWPKEPVLAASLRKHKCSSEYPGCRLDSEMAKGGELGSSATNLWSRCRRLSIKQVLSAPRSPWQRAYVERVIGTIRRECLDHLTCSTKAACTDIFTGPDALGIAKDTPQPRPVQLPEAGRIISIPEPGGRHHRYERRAASTEHRSQACLE